VNLLQKQQTGRMGTPAKAIFLNELQGKNLISRAEICIQESHLSSYVTLSVMKYVLLNSRIKGDIKEAQGVVNSA